MVVLQEDGTCHLTLRFPFRWRLLSPKGGANPTRPRRTSFLALTPPLGAPNLGPADSFQRR